MSGTVQRITVNVGYAILRKDTEYHNLFADVSDKIF